MMNNYISVDKQITDIDYEYYQKKDTIYCDNIMSFDIEVSSFFLKDGIANTFDKTKPSKYWEDYEKVSLCYIWQFAIDGNVYYGRELEQFLLLIDDLNSINDNCKLALIENGFEPLQRYVETLRKIYTKKYYKNIISQYNW